MKAHTLSSLFVSSMTVGSLLPTLLASTNIDNIQIRSTGAPNTLDFELYYGNLYL